MSFLAALPGADGMCQRDRRRWACAGGERMQRSTCLLFWLHRDLLGLCVRLLRNRHGQDATARLRLDFVCIDSARQRDLAVKLPLEAFNPVEVLVLFFVF